MNIEELKIENFQNRIYNAITNKEDCLLYSIIPANIVYAGKGDIDYDYCLANNYLVYPSIDVGKGLVATKGDLVIVLISYSGWNEYKKLANTTIDYLRSKGLNAAIISNDVMVDNVYKVASYSSVNIGNNVIYTGFQATFNPNVKDIECICKRPLVKIPKGLSDYGIDANNLLQELLKIYKES